MNCPKCSTELILTRSIFRNASVHFASYCGTCKQYKYWPQTDENRRIWQAIPFKKSRPLKIEEQKTAE
jgi:hypothetical protein